MSALIQIRSVPEETRRILKARAAEAGKSFNTLLVELLEREASRPTVSQVLERAAMYAGRGTSGPSSVELLEESRGERDDELDERR